MGKSVLADALVRSHGFTHFDGDHWALGVDPVAINPTPAASPPAVYKERLAGLSSFILQLRQEEKPASGPGAAWEPFYAALCDDVQAWRAGNRGADLVVTHSIYCRSMRDFVRKRLGDDLVFIALELPLEL